jgi:hypothetical protein
MLQNLAWQATDNLARAQLDIVRTMAAAISLTGEDQRKALNLTRREWAAWTAFHVDSAPLPAEPPLPEMLQRVGAVAFNLSGLLDRRSVAAASGR